MDMARVKLSAFRDQLSAISYQLSAFSFSIRSGADSQHLESAPELIADS
jgi:hypothetical protein